MAFNKAKNFLKNRKMSFVFIRVTGRVSISLDVSQEESKSILLEVIVHVSVCVSVCVCVYACVCVCACMRACVCLHSWKSRAESLHLALVPGVSAVIPLKGRQALAPSPENKRSSLTKISLH